MKTGMEQGLEMVRRFGPPVPPMMPPFAQPPPPPPAAAVPFTAPFPGMSRLDNNDNNNRYGNYLLINWLKIKFSIENRRFPVLRKLPFSRSDSAVLLSLTLTLADPKFGEPKIEHPHNFLHIIFLIFCYFSQFKFTHFPGSLHSAYHFSTNANCKVLGIDMDVRNERKKGL